MKVEICPGCGERFHCFEGDDQICTKCLPPEDGSLQTPDCEPPVAVEVLDVKGNLVLDTAV